MSPLLFLYSIGIRVYGLLVFLASLFDKKASDWIQGRKGQFSHIKEQKQSWGHAPIIIVHAASYGEHEMSKPIINQLKRQISNLKIVVSFYSPSGYNNVTFDDPNFYKIYLPLDTQSNQNTLIEILQPKAVIFIKYEFWFNLLRSLKTKNIPFYYTSLHINANSYLFKKITSPFLDLIRNARLIFAHNEDSKSILLTNNFNNVKVIGDTRVDKAIENKNSESPDLRIPKSNKKTILIGSLTEEDIDMVVDYINQQEEYNYVIAPHDIDDVSILNITSKLERNYELFTSNKESKILIINTLGDLKLLYRYADIVYVGGGFSKGPHNVIEPLVYGVKVFCGPNIKKFPMAITLVKSGLLHILDSQSQFDKSISKLKNNDTEDHKKRCDIFINKNRSRIELLVKDLQEVLNEN